MNKYSLIFLVLIMSSCTIKNRPIDYGTDDCDYCKMTIMDHRYGSELVSEKGKIYTFDAAECLIEYIYHNEEIGKNAHSILVTSYTTPDQLIDATTATYLVSREMPSPMGANLTAFSSKETAIEFQDSKGGNLYTWEELTSDFRAIRSKRN